MAEAFKQWLRGRPCAVENRECKGPMVAAHVDHAGGKGMGTKVADMNCIPLCDGHHQEQHKGWRSFETKYRINAVALAQAYWRAWPGRAKWEAQNDA